MALSEDGEGSKVRSRDGNLAAFFEPARNRVARNPEGARKTSEARALLVSVQDLLTSLWRIGVGGRILAALPAAVVAEVLLFAVWGLAVLDDVFTVAVVAGNDLSNHSWILSFGLDPLPTLRNQLDLLNEEELLLFLISFEGIGVDEGALLKLWIREIRILLLILGVLH